MALTTTDDIGREQPTAFLSVASRVEVDAFFRYLGEDVAHVDDERVQRIFELAFSHLLGLSHRALRRAMSAEREPMGTPSLRHQNVVVRARRR